MAAKVAIVTGANKGIGFGIVKGLCERFEGDVYLTSRDVARGEAAVKELNKSGLKPFYHQLDVTDVESIKRFGDYIKEKHGGIDLLINNAGIAFSPTSTVPYAVQAEETILINYFSIVYIYDILFPLLRPNARVINLTSSVGHLSHIPGENIRKKFAKKDLTVPQLSEVVKEFVETAKEGAAKVKAEGWGEATHIAYVVSKVAVSALTFIQDKKYGPKGISVNCVHPGYVDTDLTEHKGPLTIEEGCVATLYLALDAPQNVKGVFMWRDKQIVDWLAPKTPSLH